MHKLLFWVRAPPFEFEKLEHSNISKSNGGKNLQFNNGKERLAFEKEWEEKRKFYSEQGMSESAIDELYEFDLAVHNSDRRFKEHNSYIEEIPELEIPNNSMELDKYGSRHWWVNELNNPRLAYTVCHLSKLDIEILTMYAMERYSENEISKRLNVSQTGVSYRIKIFAELFADLFKKEKSK